MLIRTFYTPLAIEDVYIILPLTSYLILIKHMALAPDLCPALFLKFLQP